MRPHRVLIPLALGLFGAPCSILADVPQINGTSPRGVVRGVPSDITITGSNLSGNPQLITPIPFTIEQPAEGSDASKWLLKLLVPAEVPLGVYPIRVKTDDGISNPFLLAVGQLSIVPEKEENNAFEQAQAVTTPCTVEGQVAGNDVDFCRFSGKKGQRIVIDAACSRVGSGVDPQIRLTTASRRYVDSADDTPGLLTDARMFVTLPEDGDYVLEISDSKYQGQGNPDYRLTIGAIPYATDVYPLGGRRGETVGFELRGGTIEGVRTSVMTLLGSGDEGGLRASTLLTGLTGPTETAMDITVSAPIRLSDVAEIREPSDDKAAPPRGAVPAAFNGRIDPAEDEDRFSLAVVPGQKVRIRVEASEFGSALDGSLRILDAKGGALSGAEDTTIQPVVQRRQRNAPGVVLPDPSIDFTVGSNTTEIVLVLRDLLGRGGPGYGYRIEVDPIESSFGVIPNDAQINIPKGGVVAVPVTLMRYGYNGPVTIGLADPPAGVTFRPGIIPSGQTVGVFSVSVAPEATVGAMVLKVVGTGKDGDRVIEVAAEKPVSYAQIGNLPTKILTQQGLAAAPMQVRPVVLDVPEAVEAVHGLGTPVVIKSVRGEKGEGELALSTLPLSAGIQIPNAKIDAKAAEGTATVNVATEAPFESFSVALTAKGKIDGKDQTFFTPSVRLNLIRPTSLELETKQVEIKAGGTVEVKGKLTRKGGHKEPITVKIDGLPAGLKADPVTVAPESVDFVLKVTAEGSAAEATATAKLALAFKIGGKDYPFPTTDLPVKVVK